MPSWTRRHTKMITGKKLLSLEEFDRYRRAVTKRIGQAQVGSRTTIINNTNPTEIIGGDYIPRLSSKIFCAVHAYNTGLGYEIGQNLSSAWSGTANSNDDKHRYIRIRAANTTGSYGYAYTDYMNLTRQGHNPLFMARIKMGPDITNMRLWIGLTDTFWSGSGDDPADRYIAMLRYSTAIDGNFYYCTKDAVTLNAQNSGLAAAINQEILLKIEAVDASDKWLFSINDAYSKELTVNLPGTSQDLGWMMGIWTLENAYKEFEFSSQYLEHD